MNPGFLSLWIITMLLILITTGWGQYVWMNIDRRKLAFVSCCCLLLQPLHWRFDVSVMGIELHVSIIVALIAALLAMKGQLVWDSVFYLLLCAALTGMIWGCIQKMYSADPVFYWIDPIWDAPLVAGLLVAIFSIKAHYQFTVLLLSAAAAELVNAALQSGRHIADIGSLSWWDGLWIAFAFARMASVLFQMLRMLGNRVSAITWRNKGGSSPE